MKIPEIGLTDILGQSDDLVEVTLKAPAEVWQFILGILSTVPDPSEIIINEMVGPIGHALITAAAGQEPAA